MRTKLLVTGLVLAQLGLVGAPARAAASFGPTEWVIGPQRKVAFITLDGQARAKKFVGVLDTLKQKRAKATFFTSGSWIAHHKTKSRLVHARGHLMGNRGYTTEHFTSLSDDELRSSITRAATVLNQVGQFPRPFLRSPDGARDLRVLRIAGAMGYRHVRWTYSPGGGTTEGVIRKSVSRAQPGYILSLDIWRKSHRRALPKIIGGLRRRGYDIRTLDKLTDAHAVRWDVTLRSGSSGAEVKWLQKRLRYLTYPSGSINGSFGYATLEATYAFEKVHGMSRDGVVPPSQMTAIAMGRRPKAPKPLSGNPKDYIDVDISRQVLFEVRNGHVTHTLPVSTGNGETYTVDGDQRTARTPRGSFAIQRKIQGERHGSLGTLYWPNYFYGGYAIHGSDSVPTYPASHGCVRIPRYIERAFYYRTPIGLPVYVHD
jgi:peptidoglycan/xylan/chitin deacetylase (PgdA/CDA1 family)